MDKGTVYVLQLKDGKYYVGYTTRDRGQRINDHFENRGASWTKQYKPVKVLQQFAGTLISENETTLRMMEEYGWNNVRGGGWCQIDMARPPRKLLQRILRKDAVATFDRCFHNSARKRSACLPKDCSAKQAPLSSRASSNEPNSFNLIAAPRYTARRKDSGDHSPREVEPKPRAISATKDVKKYVGGNIAKHVTARRLRIEAIAEANREQYREMVYSTGSNDLIILPPERDDFLLDLIKKERPRKEYINNITVMITYRAQIDRTSYKEWMTLISGEKVLLVTKLVFYIDEDLVHVMVSWDKEFRSRDNRVLDHKGSHPTLRSIRNKSHVLRISEYVKDMAAYVAI